MVRKARLLSGKRSKKRVAKVRRPKRKGGGLAAAVFGSTGRTVTIERSKPATPKDPIEGFHITDYDAETETLTISADKALFKHKPSMTAMQNKAVEIMVSGPSVSKVVFVPRDG